MGVVQTVQIEWRRQGMVEEGWGQGGRSIEYTWWVDR